MNRYKHRSYKKQPRRFDPLLPVVLTMLVLAPVINACSSSPKPTVTKIDTGNVKTNSLQLPDGYEWEEKSQNSQNDEYSNPEEERASFEDPETAPFVPNRNAPTSTRLTIIEDQLISLRDDFNTLYPSMRRLMAIEQDMQLLISELKSLTMDVAKEQVVAMPSKEMTREEAIARANELKKRVEQGDNIDALSITQTNTQNTQGAIDLTQPPTAQTSSQQTLSELEKNMALPKPPQTILATATGLRIGIHSNSVRAVIDFSQGSQVQYKESFTNNGKTFEVYLPNTEYTGRKSWQSDYVPAIQSYSVTKNEADSYVTFKLEEETSLKSIFVIPAKPSQEKARLVIDFTQ